MPRLLTAVLLVLRPRPRRAQRGLRPGTTGALVAGDDAAHGGASGITLLNGDHGLAVRDVAGDNAGTGICDCGGRFDTVAGNHVAASGDEGLLVGFGAEHATVRGNTVTAAAGDGIVFDGATSSSARSNVLHGNADGIVIVGDDDRVAGNLVTDSRGCPDGCGMGISVEGGLRDVVAGNTVVRAADRGIRLDAYAGETGGDIFRDNIVRGAGRDDFGLGEDAVGPIGRTLVEGNRAFGAADDGFEIRTPGTTLTRNRAERNGDLGFEVVAGAIDGGGNRSALNGNPLQCVGIAC